MRRVQDTICDEVPHLRVSILEILLHPQDCLARPVYAVLHFLELRKGLFHRSAAVYAGGSCAWAVVVTAPRRMNLVAFTGMGESFDSYGNSTHLCNGKYNPYLA